MMKKLLSLIALLTLLAACNTFEGVGKDIQKAGETIENASKKK
jgi:predicted small secreted protein